MDETLRSDTHTQTVWPRVGVFVAVCFAWSWGFWFTAGLLGGATEVSYAYQIYFLGAFGPGLGGIVALRLTSTGSKLAVGVPGFVVGATLAVVALALAALRGSGGGTTVSLSFADLSPFSAPVGALLALAIVLASGYVFGSIGSPNATVASYFAGLKPDRRTVVLAIPILLWFPTLGMVSYLLESIVVADAAPPSALDMPLTELLRTFAMGLFIVAVLTGGNEEHGWRGVLQPTLHRAVNPLLASFFILLLWDLWHLPLHATGFYGEEFSDPFLAFVLRLPNMALLTLLFTAVYNMSRGSIFLCVLLHASYNASARLFFTESSSGYAIVMALLVVAGLVFFTRMWRRSSGYSPDEPQGH